MLMALQIMQTYIHEEDQPKTVSAAPRAQQCVLRTTKEFLQSGPLVWFSPKEAVVERVDQGAECFHMFIELSGYAFK